MSNPDGSIIVTKDKLEIIAYYDKQIAWRINVLVKLMALGADTGSIQTRIIQLNAERKQKLLEVQKYANNYLEEMH